MSGTAEGRSSWEADHGPIDRTTEPLDTEQESLKRFVEASKSTLIDLIARYDNTNYSRSDRLYNASSAECGAGLQHGFMPIPDSEPHHRINHEAYHDGTKWGLTFIKEVVLPNKRGIGVTVNWDPSTGQGNGTAYDKPQYWEPAMTVKDLEIPDMIAITRRVLGDLTTATDLREGIRTQRNARPGSPTELVAEVYNFGLELARDY